MKFLLDNRNQHAGRRGSPGLRLDSVLAVAQELLDLQVLLERLDEQLDLLVILVECSDGQRGQHKIVGLKDQGLVFLCVLESNVSEVRWVMLVGVKAVEQHCLIPDGTRCPVGWGRVKASGIEVDLGTRHNESARLVYSVESSKVQIAPIHDVKRSSLDWHEVEHVDFVHLAVVDMDKRRDGASQVQKSVELDRTLARGGAQGAQGILQVEADQIGVALKLARSTNQESGYIRPNAPVARLVGVCQRRAKNAVAQPHHIQFVRIRARRHFDIARTLAQGQLGECHHTKLLRAGHASHAVVADVTIDNLAKAHPRHERHDLCK